MYYTVSPTNTVADSHLMVICEQFVEGGFAERMLLDEIVVSVDLVPLNLVGEGKLFVLEKRLEKWLAFLDLLLFVDLRCVFVSHALGILEFPLV